MPWACVNGVSLRYDLCGQGKPLALLHEMGGGLDSWDFVVPLLPGHAILRFDARGAGLSEKIVGRISLDDLVDDFAALLDHLGLGAVALAGVAVGAAVALRFAARFPARAAALVAMAPATHLPPDRRAATLALADRFETEGVRPRLLERFDHSFPAVYRGDDRFAAFRGRALANDPRSYAAIHRMLADMDVTPDLGRIACKTLVLAGATDTTRPAALVRAVAAAIPGARFAEIASGHVMPMLTPGLVAAALAGFLGDEISSIDPANLV